MPFGGGDLTPSPPPECEQNRACYATSDGETDADKGSWNPAMTGQDLLLRKGRIDSEQGRHKDADADESEQDAMTQGQVHRNLHIQCR